MNISTLRAENHSLEVIAGNNCSLIVFCNVNEISGMLQLQSLRFSLSFNNEQFKSLLAICENKTTSANSYKIFQQPDELYPIIWQLSASVRLYLKQEEWQDLCDVIIRTKTKYYNPLSAVN